MPGEKLLNWSLLVLITISLIVHWCLAISCLSSVSPKCSIAGSTCTLSLNSILLGTISRIRMLELWSSLELLLRKSRLWGSILSLIGRHWLRLFWEKLLLLIMSLWLFCGGYLIALFKLLKKFGKRWSSWCYLLMVIFIPHAPIFRLLRLIFYGWMSLSTHTRSYLWNNMRNTLRKKCSMATSPNMILNTSRMLLVH